MMRRANDCEGPQLILWGVSANAGVVQRLYFSTLIEAPSCPPQAQAEGTLGRAQRSPHLRPQPAVRLAVTHPSVCTFSPSNALSRAAAICLTTWILTLSSVGGRIRGGLRGPGPVSRCWASVRLCEAGMWDVCFLSVCLHPVLFALIYATESFSSGPCSHRLSSHRRCLLVSLFFLFLLASLHSFHHPDTDLCSVCETGESTHAVSFNLL